MPTRTLFSVLWYKIEFMLIYMVWHSIKLMLFVYEVCAPSKPCHNKQKISQFLQHGAIKSKSQLTNIAIIIKKTVLKYKKNLFEPGARALISTYWWVCASDGIEVQMVQLQFNCSRYWTIKTNTHSQRCVQMCVFLSDLNIRPWWICHFSR